MYILNIVKIKFKANKKIIYKIINTKEPKTYIKTINLYNSKRILYIISLQKKLKYTYK